MAKFTPTIIHTSVDKAGTLAAALSKKIIGGEIFALIGPLGAGKTTFAQHLVKELGYKKRVTSPTFTLLQIYEVKRPRALYIQHLDLYRLEKETEAIQSGLIEEWGQPNTVTLIEWADKFPNLIPQNSTSIIFSLK